MYERERERERGQWGRGGVCSGVGSELREGERTLPAFPESLGMAMERKVLVHDAIMVVGHAAPAERQVR